MAWRSVCASHGRNLHGVLGLGHDKQLDSDKPFVMHSLDGINIKGISCGRSHTCVITENGDVYTWGRNVLSCLGLGEFDEHVYSPTLIRPLRQHNVEVVSCGDAHTAAITETGEIFMWGWQIVESFEVDEEYAETFVTHPQKFIIPHRIRYLQCSSSYTIAIDVLGRVLSWGIGTEGRLGHGDMAPQVTPKIISALIGFTIVSVATAPNHVLALSDQGRVFVWGCGSQGQLGLGRDILSCTAPRQLDLKFLDTDDVVVGVACGDAHSIVWTRDGLAYSFGCSRNFRLGFKSETNVFEPTQIPDLSNVERVSCGALSNTSIHKDGKRSCMYWGGIMDCDFEMRLLCTHCRVAQCGSYHTLLYTGKFAVPNLPFFPSLSIEEQKELEPFMFSVGANQTKSSVQEHTLMMKQHIGHLDYKNARGKLQIRLAEEELEQYQNDPLLGAEVAYEFSFMNFRFQRAVEHEKDRNYYNSKQRATSYEENEDVDIDFHKFLVF